MSQQWMWQFLCATVTSIQMSHHVTVHLLRMWVKTHLTWIWCGGWLWSCGVSCNGLIPVPHPGDLVAPWCDFQKSGSPESPEWLVPKKTEFFSGSLTGVSTNFKGPILNPSGRDHPIVVSNVALKPPHYPRSTCLDHVPISTWKCPFGTELFLLGILMRSLKVDLKRRSKKSRPCLSATLW